MDGQIKNGSLRYWRGFFAIVAVLAAAGLTGCLGQNPYPSQGAISATPNTPSQNEPVYYIQAPQAVDFQEGQEGGFILVPRVPAGQNPVVSVSGLPQGANFDPATYKFSWTPAFGMGHDPSDPTVFEKHYHVQFQVRGSQDPITVGYTCDVELIVQAVPSPLVIQADQSSYDVQEGQELKVVFHVQSKDCPKGPFDLQVSTLPDGAVVVPSDTDPTKFTLEFTPPYNFVTNQDGTDANGYVNQLQLSVTAVGPRAQKVQSTVPITVHDVRQPPAVSVGDNLTFSYAAEFSVFAEDMNGEAPPTISVEPYAFGTVSVENPSSAPTAVGSNPVQVSVVHWTGIPANQMNQPQQLTLQICSNPGPTGSDCVTQVVHMTFVGQLYSPPSFDRTNWEEGAVNYIRLGTSQQYSIPVSDPSDSNDVPTVTVSPASMQNEVSYSNGTITITPQSTGTKVFELVAISSYGIVNHESFTYRVLPKSWGQMLVLGQSLKDTEVEATLPLLTDTQVLNPSLDAINSSELILRNALYITTSAIESGLSSQDLGTLFETVTSTLPRTVISSPLVGKFPQPVLPSDVTLVGRFNDLNIANKPALRAMSIVPSKDSVFVASTKPVKLNESLTSESANPMIFSVSPYGACDVLANLVKDKVSLPVVVECTLSSGNKVLLSGFEWGDVFLDPQDAGLTQKWLSAWLSTSSSAASPRIRFRDQSWRLR